MFLMDKIVKDAMIFLNEDHCKWQNQHIHVVVALS